MFRRLFLGLYLAYEITGLLVTYLALFGGRMWLARLERRAAKQAREWRL